MRPKLVAMLGLALSLRVTAQSLSAPLQVNAKTMQSLRVRSVPPVYPASEQAQGVSGDVTLDVVLAPGGKVQSVTVVSATNEAFAAAAQEAVEHWIYKGYVLNGQAVSVAGDVEVHFRTNR